LPEIVQEIGAYAGLAAVAGLAVLSVLYFSQARDVKRLREWAGRAPERAAELGPHQAVPGRVQAQPQPGKPQAGQPPAVPQAGQPPAVPQPGGAQPGGGPLVPRPGVPAMPAATGAGPATATQAKPAGTPTPGAKPGQPGEDNAGAPKPATAATGAAAGAAADAPAKPDASTPPGDAPSPDAPAAGGSAPPTGTPSATDAPKPDGADSPTPDAPPSARAGAPATAAAAAAAAGAAAQADSPGAPSAPGGPSTPAAGRPAGAPRTPVPPGARSSGPPVVPAGSSASAAGRAPVRPVLPARPMPQPTQVIPPQRRRWYRNPRYAVLAIAGVLIVGGAGAFGITQLLSDDQGSAPAGQTPVAGSGDDNGGEATNGNGRKKRAVVPGNVTVAVLNGTTVPGLAQQVADQASKHGFQVGTVANTADQQQQRAESVVLYAPGHEREARAVNNRLGINQRQPIDPGSQELAGDAAVVVIAGSDLGQ
jgi:hypothetical protein